MRGFGLWSMAWVGAILTTLFFSELVFWNPDAVHMVVSRDATGLALLCLVFAICTLGLSAALSRSGGRYDLAVWVLAGSLFGWIVEGAMFPGVYEAPPQSMLWPALAWHMPVTILGGVWLLPKLLRNGALGQVILASAVTGVLWGVWASGVWVDNAVSLALFVQFTLMACLIGLPGLVLLAFSAPALATMPLWAQRMVAIALLCLFALTGAGQPIWVTALVVMLAVVWSALPPAPPRPMQRIPLRPGAIIPLLLIPLGAVLSHTAMFALGVAAPAEVVKAAMMLGSAALLIWAIWRGFTTR